VDGWAHNTQPGLETFFTPWHALFYSGFGAVAAWMGWSVWRRRPAAGSWRAAVPAGYGLGLAGTALFLLSGIGDLIVTTLLRSAWADPALGRRAGLGRLLPAVLSVTLAGGAAITLGVQCVLMQAVTGLDDAGLAVLGLAGAAVVEALLAVLRPAEPPRRRMRAFCAAAPVGFWGVYLGGIALGDRGLGWKPELWGGALVWSSLTLLALGMVMFPPPVPVGTAGRQAEDRLH
jgi:hypothetical protein